MSTPTAQQPWEFAAGHSLTELLEVSLHDTSGGCRWRRGLCEADDEDRVSAAAWLVAEEIMRLRCGPAQSIFANWRAAATNQPLTDGADVSFAEAFVAPTFGLPPVGASLQHAEGHVAEITWRMLIGEEQLADRPIVMLALPDSDVTSPGGDGFVVYQDLTQQELIFRLWEIKKRDGAGGVAGSIGNAYAQLEKNATRYLAKITGQSQSPDTDPDLLALLADLVPAWKRADTCAGAGVAVAANAQGLPTTAFSTMHTRFPLITAGGVEGCLVGLGSLLEFATDVRRTMWSGLSTTTS